MGTDGGTRVRAVLNDTERDELVVTELDELAPKPHELVVRVRAAGVNRADLNARRGGRRITPRPEEAGQPPIAGLELAGEVTAVGSDVTGWSVGDRVMARGRGYAEQATVDAAAAMRVPDGVAWEQAGGSPIALMTMHDALRTAGRLRRGESVVVNAATSGVGVVGCRVVAALGASVVFATSRSAEKLRVLADELGELACPVIYVNTSDESLPDVVAAHTGGHGVDVIVDHIGAAALGDNIAAAAIRGRIVQVGRLGGRTAEIDLDELARKRIELVGVTFRTRTTDEVRAVVRALLDDLGERLAEVGPRIDQVFPLEQARAAQDALAANRHVGKLVLVP